MTQVTPTPTPASGNGKLGMVARFLEVLKSLTLTNALVIVLLGLAVGPAYLAWKVINDDELLAFLFSSFEELPQTDSECGIRRATVRGRGETFFVSHNFAHFGQDRWYVGVNVRVDPEQSDRFDDYCATLTAMTDKMRSVKDPELKYPGSQRLVFP